MGDEVLNKDHSGQPSPDSLCCECNTISGEALLQTRPFQQGTNYMHYNEAGHLEEEHSTPSTSGIYHTLFLKDPSVSVKTCAACRLFHKAVYSGITLSEPSVLKLCLQKKRHLVEVEDVIKVERERERAEQAGEIANLDGKGTVSVFVDYGSIAAWDFPRRAIGQTGSDESVTCIQRWVNYCDTKHPTCRLGLVGDVIDLEPQMPSRVIDVVSFEGFANPRLLETNGLRGRYIAVSHSWGALVKPYTTKKNFETLKKGIVLESLPKTFRDAIFIARRLRVQYVWIDSICIIQDNHEDWKREARTMGLVYEKAYLAISASESAGDHAGFLTPNCEVKMDAKLPFKTGDTSSGHVYLRGKYTGVIEPGRTAIRWRGWVLQERTLSRRILHFDGTQVHWECSQYRLSEDGDQEDTTSNVNTSYFLGQNIKPLVGKSSRSDISNHAERHEALKRLYHFYACKVKEFSECKLTLASDKLPAILGLGNEISRGTGIRCLEGHLFFDEPLFAYSLLWYTEISTINGSGVPDQVRAPSWSWAAMEGLRVFYLLGQDIDFDRRIFMKIRSVYEIEGLPLRPFNALACFGRAIASMKGEYISNSNHFSEWGSRRLHQDVEEFKAPMFSYQLLDPIENFGSGWPRKSSVRGWVCFDSKEIRPENFFFVPVCAPLAGQEDTHPETTRGCLGLIVTQVYINEQHNVSGTYQRLGLGGLNNTSWFDQKEEVEFLLL